MAEKYEIIIRVPNGDGESINAPPVASEGSEAKKTPQAAEKNVGRYIASQTIMPMINAATTAVSGNIATYSGSTQMQQRIDLAQKAISTVVGGYSNIAAATALAGSMSAGVGIGLAITAVQAGINLATKAMQLQLGKVQEAEQLSLARQRYSAAYNGSRGG